MTDAGTASLPPAPLTVKGPPTAPHSPPLATWQAWYVEDYFAIFAWSVVISALMHWPMLAQEHREGDEQVYVALAQQMNWNWTHYTTRDDPHVNYFPSSIYTGPLFHQPPLYPWLIKLGLAWEGNPLVNRREFRKIAELSVNDYKLMPPRAVAMAYLISLAATIAGLRTLWRLMILFRIEPQWGWLAFAALVLCPLTTVSTMRLNNDGLMGLTLLCGLGTYAEALSRRSYALGWQAAAWLVIAFNLRYNAVIAGPLIVGFPLYFAWAQSQAVGEDNRRTWWSRIDWRMLLLVLVPVVLLGGQHLFRLFATYGSILPSDLLQSVDQPAWAEFQKMVSQTTRIGVFVQLFLFVPLLAFLVWPASLTELRQGLHTGSWPACFVISFIYLLIMQLIFGHFMMRYYAGLLPLVHCCWPTLFRANFANERLRGLAGGFIALSLLLMTLTYMLNGLWLPTYAPRPLPSAVLLWPTLLEWFADR